MKILLASVLILLFISCEKDQNNTIPPKAKQTSYLDSICADTIFPLPYFPAYPGSWWDYSDGSRIEIYHSYRRVNWDSIENIKERGYWVKQDMYCYRPAFKNDTNLTITGYSFGPHYFPTHRPWDQIYYTNYFTTSRSRHPTSTLSTNDYNFITADSLDFSLEVNGTIYNDVIRVLKIYYPRGYWDPWKIYPSRSYYAKDIGIIREDIPQDSTNKWVIKRELVGYHIND